MREIIRKKSRGGVSHCFRSSASCMITTSMFLSCSLLLVAVDASTPSPALASAPSTPSPAPTEGPIAFTSDDGFEQFISGTTGSTNQIYGWMIGVFVLFVFASFILLAISAKRKGQAENNMIRFDANILEDMMTYENTVRYTSTQLRAFTNNYSTILGSGAFGKVYLGKLPNGVRCAVKVLQRNLDRKTEEQFKAEVLTIGRTYHVNLVRLYGFCYDRNESALVYEFMKNGSLDKYLFHDNINNINQENGMLLSWPWERLFEIALGTAKGMAYLHEECHQRIIHYDIKPANILLDHNYTPKVADFGLAKLCNRDQTHVTMTGYRGTPGYSAPEFLLHNFPISYKCDVYSFGMLLFEILGQRKNTRVGDTSSLDWFPSCVWEKHEKGELEELIISCGIEDAHRERAQRLANVALWCVQDSPQVRPRMSVVVKMLEGGVEILPPPKPFGFMSFMKTSVINSSMNNGSESVTSGEEDSNWYKNTKEASIMFESEIQIYNGAN